MRLILDLHGVLCFRFPLRLYRKKVRAALKDFDLLKEIYKTGAMVFYKLGKLDEYIRILDSLPVYKHKEYQINKELKYLSKKFSLFVVTDSSRRNCMRTLRACGYEDIFSGIITLEDMKVPKPSLHAYEKVINPNELNICIGDRVTDLTPALKLGCLCILASGRVQVLKWLRRLNELI